MIARGLDVTPLSGLRPCHCNFVDTLCGFWNRWCSQT
jgi:hypothetical protein